MGAWLCAGCKAFVPKAATNPTHPTKPNPSQAIKPDPPTCSGHCIIKVSEVQPQLTPPHLQVHVHKLLIEADGGGAVAFAGLWGIEGGGVEGGWGMWDEGRYVL